MDGNLLYTVRNKFWTFFVRKALVYDKDGNQVAFMKKKFWSFHDHYFIETKLGQMEIRGNILCFDYHISLKGKEIGHVSRKISLRDSFVLDLDDEYKKELPFFVALVIAIDNITDQRRDDNSNNY